MIFNTEVIYSSFTFFQGVGFLFGFFITIWCCTYIKIYILFGFVGWSIISGAILIAKIRREKKLTETKSDKDQPAEKASF